MAVAAAGQPGFIFSTDGKSAPSYDQLQKRRKVFEALMAQQMGARAPQNVGEGIHALGQGIVAGLEGRALRKAEAESAEAQKKIWGDLSSIGMASGGAGPGVGAGAGYGSATGPISDASPTPSGTADATSALPQSFLASVDRTEGGGDYDTLFGHSQRSGPFSNVRISDMTVGQAIDFASPSGAYGQFVKGKVGRVATPMGRHQIVGTTLRNAAAEMGLDPSTPFNQQTQDSIAAHLARKRVASADSMPGKIAALRSEWEGFRHVPDAQMATIVADLQNGGSMPAAASAPVQVASLDPAAGVAEATRAGASISTAPTTGGQQPVPANVPVPTAREAIERAIAKVGGASPAAFGADDVAALEARPRDPQAVAYAGPGATIDPRDVPQLQSQPGTVTAPGSVADQQADALIAGDPERPIMAPVPTPRPEMAQAGGIPPQAVAASAMAQQPAPFDPVNGTAMGGNTGAADAAKAAYLEANGGTPAVQRVAQVMVDRGMSPTPTPTASPAVQQVAQAYGQRQAQDQAQGRFQQLMGVVTNPAASPEQRQYAAGLLEQDRQFQTQQQARDWEMLKLRESRAYDERKAERERAAGNEDYATRKKIDLQFQKPEGVDWQELPNGDYGYFDPATRRFEKLGSAPKADSGGITIGPDGTVQIGGGVKMPANFMPDPDNPNGVKPIPGGPGEQLPAELAGRIAIADSFLGQAGPLREQLAGGGATGLWDRFQAGNNSSSDQAGVYRKLQSGADALQRLLTGAGMTESEATVYAGRYLPTYTDDAASAVSKLDQMTREIENARGAALRGRGGIGANVTPNGANASAGGASDYKTKYGLE